jgi:hypothetical protein
MKPLKAVEQTINSNVNTTATIPAALLIQTHNTVDITAQREQLDKNSDKKKEIRRAISLRVHNPFFHNSSVKPCA